MYRFGYQITVVILMTTVTIASIVGYIGLQSNLASARSQAEEQLLASAQVVARKCETYFQSQESSAKAIKNMVESTYDTGQAASNPQYLVNYRNLVGPAIKASAESTPGCVVAYFWLNSPSSTEPYALSYCRDARKDVFIALPDPQPEQFNSSRYDMQWYYQTLENKAPYWALPFYSSRVGRTIMPFSVPAMRDGVTIGVVGQAIDTETLRQALYDVNLYSSGYAQILDANGDSLVEWRKDPADALFNQNEDAAEFLSRSAEIGKQGVVIVSESHSDVSAPLYSAFVRLSNGFVVAVSVPETEILAPVIKVQHMYWGILGFFFIISTILAIVWGRQLSMPLKTALEYAEALASNKGDEDILCLMAVRTDEFGDIARKLKQAVHNHSEEIRHSHMELVYRLSQVSKLRDLDTAKHVSRVSNYAALLASLAGLEVQSVMSIFLTSSMHDIGKIGIPDSILLKPGPLDDEEFRIMKEHPIIGAAIFEDGAWPMMEVAYIMTLHHHERWDGKGYPSGLKEESIPIEARICGLCDAFDAMTTPRVYRARLSFDEAVAEIRANSGQQFDPHLVSIFMGNIAGFRIIYELQDDLVYQKGCTIEQHLNNICAISGLVQGLSPAI